MRRAVARTPVRVTLPGGTQIGGGDAAAPEMLLHRPEDLFARLGSDLLIGFGESYMAGDWDAGEGTDLADLLTPFAARLTRVVPRPLQALRRLVAASLPAHERGTLDGARQNISRHYDLSNELFASFLDPTMSYSSAAFAPGAGRCAQDLEAAQLRKIDLVLDLAGVAHGTRLLEIGTGWGALAIRAAQRGAEVTTVTISAEQRELARERIRAAGVERRVEVRLEDYREVQGSYDAIVSVEMIEAVGEEFWPVFFARLDALLAPGGRIGLQAITMDHGRMLATRGTYGWIHKYVFPGGMIPSPEAIDAQLRAHTRLRVDARRELGADYATTLRLWRARFLANWAQTRELGFDETFRRMWELYLAYCEAGFRARYLGVQQLGIAERAA
jgi:cyclopropane-fatty-acyl-phospholipid synthase